ncbi:MAG: monovalent cation/H(+) antiporter subunit G [Anaerolineae bacterium]
MDLLTLIILLLYVLGFFFNFTAVIGIIRMPDLYCRLHSSSKNTTLGSLLIVLGLVLRQLQAGQPAAAAKVLLIAILLLLVTPIGSHALARAAYKFGIPLWDKTVVDQYADLPSSAPATAPKRSTHV